MRYMYNVAAKVREIDYYVCINRDFKSDLFVDGMFFLVNGMGLAF